jgi:AcrR family transcriptional regulator
VDTEEASARERILATAARLFYERGFGAVGVDLIVAEAAVAKTTLYRHFPSKDDLVVAWLEHANADFLTWFDTAVAGRAAPARRLARFFDAVEALATGPTCLGCTFQASAVEFPDPSHPAHVAALAHKAAVRARLRDLAAEAGAHDPGGLGDGLLMLLDGAFAAARMYARPDSPASQVAATARTLIHQATARPRPTRQ